jgi:hypothetical protein
MRKESARHAIRHRSNYLLT